MAPRRASTRGGSTSRANWNRAPGGIRRNTRSRQQPNRYGHPDEQPSIHPDSQAPSDPPSDSDEAEPSTPEYSHSSSSSTNAIPQSRSPVPQQRRGQQQEIPTLPSEPDARSLSVATVETPINLNTMRELLRSHEQDIVDRVVLQLSSRNLPQSSIMNTNPQASFYMHPGTQPSIPNPTLSRIAELESQLAQLRAQSEQERITNEPSPPGMFNPTHTLTSIPYPSESASGIIESVETIFPGVERTTLQQIIENRFKPTNIYRLLASEKERAETHWTINIGGVEFEQAEREEKESEYRMSIFFKAWAVYSGILIKLAPHGLQGDLATALCIYTMNLYELLEKYTWDRVKSYHFQFHRKRVASGKSIYEPREWRQLDSELVASKCFAHPVSRGTWPTIQKPTPHQARRTYELPTREIGSAPSFTYPVPTTGSFLPPLERRINYHQPTNAYSGMPVIGSGVIPSIAPPCRNWNYR
ncbi:hypothetical protein HOY80DRAFT_1048153 [Tuber brumale]|nr:hypothetical protein HOY80DRAFT_1048153 [Tuber brumale]